MSCLCRYLSTVPAPGDGEVVILSKILQVLNDGGGSGLGGVTSISVDGGPAQTGAVSITTGGSALLNFTDENSDADGVMWGNAGTTEILRSVGATGFLQTSAARIHREVDNNVLAFLGGTSKGTSSFFEMAGQAAASPGFAIITTKGQTLGTGTFRILNAPNSSTVSTTRAEMVWEGNWIFTPTWNDGAATFTGLKLNLTDTASAAASLFLDFQVSATPRFNVAKTGAVRILGSSAAISLIHASTDTTATGLTIFEQASADADSYDLSFRKTRGTVAAPTVITSGDSLGKIMFRGYSGAAGYVTGAEIRADSSGTIATTRVPTKLVFATGTDAAPTVLTDRMTILPIGYVGINVTSPVEMLQVNGAVKVTGTVNAATVNSGVLDFSGLGTLVRSYGADAATRGTFTLLLASGTGTLGIFALFVSNTGNVGVGTVVPQDKLSILTSAGVYELLTDASNYSRLLFSTPAGNHLVQTQAIGTGTLRTLQVGTGPVAGANIAGVSSIAHGGQSTGSAVGGSYLIQVSPAGGAGSGVNALSTRVTVSSTDITHATAVRLAIASGANQRAGNATLVGGTITVANTTVTANTIVLLTRKTSGGTIGFAITYTVSANTSFTITSDNVLDTSIFSYFLIEVP